MMYVLDIKKYGDEQAQSLLLEFTLFCSDLDKSYES